MYCSYNSNCIRVCKWRVLCMIINLSNLVKQSSGYHNHHEIKGINCGVSYIVIPWLIALICISTVI